MGGRLIEALWYKDKEKVGPRLPHTPLPQAMSNLPFYCKHMFKHCHGYRTCDFSLLWFLRGFQWYLSIEDFERQGEKPEQGQAGLPWCLWVRVCAKGWQLPVPRNEPGVRLSSAFQPQLLQPSHCNPAASHASKPSDAACPELCLSCLHECPECLIHLEMIYLHLLNECVHFSYVKLIKLGFITVHLQTSPEKNFICPRSHLTTFVLGRPRSWKLTPCLWSGSLWLSCAERVEVRFRVICSNKCMWL